MVVVVARTKWSVWVWSGTTTCQTRSTRTWHSRSWRSSQRPPAHPRYRGALDMTYVRSCHPLPAHPRQRCTRYDTCQVLSITISTPMVQLHQICSYDTWQVQPEATSTPKVQRGALDMTHILSCQSPPAHPRQRCTIYDTYYNRSCHPPLAHPRQRCTIDMQHMTGPISSPSTPNVCRGAVDMQICRYDNYQRKICVEFGSCKVQPEATSILYTYLNTELSRI